MDTNDYLTRCYGKFAAGDVVMLPHIDGILTVIEIHVQAGFTGEHVRPIAYRNGMRYEADERLYSLVARNDSDTLITA